MCTDRIPGWSTSVYEPAGDPGSRVLVAVIDARALTGGETFIAVQGFQSWIEDFELQRFQLLARTLRARLIVVEVPGFGVAGSRLLSVERRALLRGDFGPLADRMFAAAAAVLDGESDRTVSFLGYSMGASVATTMAKGAAAQGWSISDLVLVEPVALDRWKIRRLVAATYREDLRIADYIATNDALNGAVAPWEQRPGVRPPTRRHLDLLLLGAALRRGALGDDLRTEVTPRHVVIVRGDRSVLSAADCAAVLSAMRERGVATAELSVPGHHAFWHSLPAVEDMALRLKDVLKRPG